MSETVEYVRVYFVAIHDHDVPQERCETLAEAVLRAGELMAASTNPAAWVSIFRRDEISGA